MRTNLYDRLGGPIGVWVLVDDLMTENMHDETVGWRFRAMRETPHRVDATKEQLRQSLGHVSGGPEPGGAPCLAHVYRALELSELEVELALSNLERLLDRYGLDAESRELAVALARGRIGGTDPGHLD